MNIKTVTYQKAFITGPFLQEKIGFEAEIDEHIQSVHDALAQLKGMAEDFHKESNPHLYQERGFSDLPEHLKTKVEFAGPHPIINLQDEKLEIEIDNCHTVNELQDWKKKHDILPGRILKHYAKRLTELRPIEY